MDIQIIYDKKMIKLLNRSWLFNFVPFLDSVFIAGSLAIGNIHENSDFDVIVKTTESKLYTSRFFCLLLFGLFNWRRSVDNPRDGFCFNCFVAGLPRRKAGNNQLILEPHNEYGRQLSSNLIPIEISRNYAVKNLERLFMGKLGISLEKFLKSWQLKRINKNLNKFENNNNKSRIILNEKRVEVCLSLKDILK